MISRYVLRITYYVYVRFLRDITFILYQNRFRER